jgi:pyroglutamyl-peptidase
VAGPRAEAPRKRGAAAGAAKVLVTGFAPFGGEGVNPSWQVVEGLPATVEGARIAKCLVPTEFRRAIAAVAEAMEEHHPDIVLCLGQAGGRFRISVERIGINIDDAAIADNAGAQPIDEPIAQPGPAAYFATVPVKAMVEAMLAAGVPAEVSNSAGTFVCNHLLYGVLHYIAAQGLATRAGFIHVPYAEGQVLDKPGTPAMAVETMARGVAAAIRAAVVNKSDMKRVGGALD